MSQEEAPNSTSHPLPLPREENYIGTAIGAFVRKAVLERLELERFRRTYEGFNGEMTKSGWSSDNDRNRPSTSETK